MYTRNVNEIHVLEARLSIDDPRSFWALALVRVRTEKNSDLGGILISSLPEQITVALATELQGLTGAGRG